MQRTDGPTTPYAPDEDGVCPHCGRGVTFQLTNAAPTMGNRAPRPPTRSMHVFAFNDDGYTASTVFASRCPSCKSIVLSAYFYGVQQDGRGAPRHGADTELLWPRTAERPLPSEVDDDEVRRTWDEAVAILALSPQASAALARRCLQHVLRTKGPGKKRDLKAEIDAASDLPSELVDSLHDLREVGNFAAHSTKDANTGEIVQVEPGEAEYTLEVLAELLDHYFVRSKRRADRRAKVQAMKDASGKKK